MNPNKIYLAQTDTTVGFLSQNALKMAKIKGRPQNKPFLREMDSFARLQHFLRVPRKWRKEIRRATKRTYIYPQKEAIRVVQDERHLRFLRRFGWMYSSSANESGKGFDLSFALQKADIILFEKGGFVATTPSSLIRLGKRKRRKIR